MCHAGQSEWWVIVVIFLNRGGGGCYGEGEFLPWSRRTMYQSMIYCTFLLKPVPQAAGIAGKYDHGPKIYGRSNFLAR